MNKSIERYIIKNKFHLYGISDGHRFFFLEPNGYYIEDIERIKNSGKFGFYISEDKLKSEIIKYNRRMKLDKLGSTSLMITD